MLEILIQEFKNALINANMNNDIKRIAFDFARKKINANNANK